MVKTALEKLNDKQKKYCETMSELLARHRESGAKLEYERNAGKLRGFLECLLQLEIITVGEMKSLYLWYFEESRYTGQ